MAGQGFFRKGGRLAWGLILAVVLVIGLSTALLASTAEVSYSRNDARMVCNDDGQLLEDVKRNVGMASDSLQEVLVGSPAVQSDKPYLVVSIEERRLWLKQGDQTLFNSQVATSSCKTLVKNW